MKRFHVHVAVEKLDESVKFYSALFAAEPTVLRPDYAKWALDDPRVNFAISQRDGATPGVNHLGVQAETAAELEELHQRLRAADIASHPETRAQCCYAESDKHWAKDPTGIVWETFHTMGQIAVYGDDHMQTIATMAQPQAAATACCG